MLLLACLSVVVACQSEPPGRDPGATTAPDLLIDPADPEKFGGPANYIANPSFEGSAQYWVPVNAYTRISIDRRVYRFGSAAALVEAREPQPFGIVAPYSVGRPSQGSVYGLSLWLRGEEGIAGRTVLVQTTESGGKTPDRTLAAVRVPLTSRWEEVRLAGRVLGPARDRIDVSVTVESSISAGTRFWLDGVNLTTG